MKLSKSSVYRRAAHTLILVGLLLITAGTLGWAYQQHQEQQAVRHVILQMTRHAHRVFPVRPTFTPTPTYTPTRSATARPPRSLLRPTPTPTLTPTPYTGAPPVRLIIPALGIDTRVVPVHAQIVTKGGQRFATWETADYAAGYHVGSAYPGQPGNLILSGHHNIKGAVFRPLAALGNEGVKFPHGAVAYVIDANGHIFAYRLEVMYKIKERGASLDERFQHAHLLEGVTNSTLTLITCWPLHDNAYRLIVQGTYLGEVLPDQIKNILPAEPR